MNNSPDRYTKKIVSQGKYAQMQGYRALCMLLGFLLFLLAGLCAFAAFCLFIAVVYSFFAGTEGVIESVVVGILTAGVGLLASGCVKACRAAAAQAAAQAEKIDSVVPLTRSTAPYLSVQESLVRASAEPPVASETILLRAVGDVSATPPEQLVRPAHTPE